METLFAELCPTRLSTGPAGLFATDAGLTRVLDGALETAATVFDTVFSAALVAVFATGLVAGFAAATARDDRAVVRARDDFDFFSEARPSEALAPFEAFLSVRREDLVGRRSALLDCVLMFVI
ncbi:MAG: hypothetical protein WC670_09160 [Pseudolabrys sp.]